MLESIENISLGPSGKWLIELTIPLGVSISTKVSKIPGIQNWHQVPESSKETSQHEFMRQICAGSWPQRTFQALRFYDSWVKSKVLLGFGSSFSLYCFGGNYWLCLSCCVSTRKIPSFFDWKERSVKEWKKKEVWKNERVNEWLVKTFHLACKIWEMLCRSLFFFFLIKAIKTGFETSSGEKHSKK